MFGWEFPPHHSGGLGTACQGLTRGLNRQGADVIFVLPKKVDVTEEYIKFVYGDGNKSQKTSHYVVNSPLKPYVDSNSYINTLHEGGTKHIYGSSLVEEVHRYGEIAEDIALQENFDVIHAHDWLTMKAGVAAKKVSKKPLIVHIHATEVDRTAGNNNQAIYEIEKEGMQEADVVVTVSQWTKNKVVDHYGIDPDKVQVVHNGIDFENKTVKDIYDLKKNQNKKIIVFIGRITIQKGPEYFVDAAKVVTDKYPDAVFVLGGSGDMERQMIEKAAAMGIADKVLFPGFLRGDDLVNAMRMADLLVMPSVSEPFGLIPIEAMFCGTPALISYQSGVAEVISHCLKVDFWDIQEMSNKILAVLKYPQLQDELIKNGLEEAKKITWDKPAQECIAIYNKLASHN